VPTEARITKEPEGAEFVERYLTVWGRLWIAAGIALDKLAPLWPRSWAY